jgi:hypothetical protein
MLPWSEIPWPDFEGYLRDMDLELEVEVNRLEGHEGVHDRGLMEEEDVCPLPKWSWDTMRV